MLELLSSSIFSFDSEFHFVENKEGREVLDERKGLGRIKLFRIYSGTDYNFFINLFFIFNISY